MQSLPQLLHETSFDEELLELDAAKEGEEVLWDYVSVGLTLRSHPMKLLRPKLDKWRLMTSAQLRSTPNGRIVRTAGIVTLRQQPDTANGTIFVSLEDEEGATQLIVWKAVREAQREVLLAARLLAVRGRWQRQGPVCNLVAEKLVDLSHLLGRLTTESRNFK